MIGYLEVMLLGFLIICALAATFVRSPMVTIITLMTFSMITSVLWIMMEAPDLAITEAAVGAGVDTILFFVVMKKVRELRQIKSQEEENQK